MKGFENKVYNFIKKRNLACAKDVCVALSGGADSVALLRCTAALSALLKISLSAVHVNHGIRGEEALRDERFCISLCEKLGVPIQVFHIDALKLAKEGKASVELAARDARYGVFAKLPFQVVMTAHNADDNAETIVYNLIRGTSVKGLAGIPPKRTLAEGKIVSRPLLCVTRAEIEDYLGKLHQEYVTDSTNLSDEYTRNAIRHRIMPEIKKINPSFAASAMALANAAAEDEAYLESACLSAVLPEGNGVRTEEIANMPYALASRAVAKVLREKDLRKNRIDAVIELAKAKSPSAKAGLAGGYEAARQYDRILIKKVSITPPEAFCQKLEYGKNKLPNGDIIICEKKSTEIHNTLTNVVIDCGKITSGLEVRSRKKGDRIVLQGGTKLVSKLMADKKIPLALRDAVPVVCDGNEIVAVAFCGVAKKYKVGAKTKETVSINFEGAKYEVQ